MVKKDLFLQDCHWQLRWNTLLGCFESSSVMVGDLEFFFSLPASLRNENSLSWIAKVYFEMPQKNSQRVPEASEKKIFQLFCFHSNIKYNLKLVNTRRKTSIWIKFQFLEIFFSSISAVQRIDFHFAQKTSNRRGGRGQGGRGAEGQGGGKCQFEINRRNRIYSEVVNHEPEVSNTGMMSREEPLGRGCILTRTSVTTTTIKESNGTLDNCKTSGRYGTTHFTSPTLMRVLIILLIRHFLAGCYTSLRPILQPILRGILNIAAICHDIVCRFVPFPANNTRLQHNVRWFVSLSATST